MLSDSESTSTTTERDSANSPGATTPTPAGTATPAVGPDDWPQVGRDATHAGAANAIASDGEPTATTEIGVDGSVTTPTVVGDTVYVTRGVPGEDGPRATLEAYALPSGERRWSRPLDVDFRYNAPYSNHRPVVHGERVYAATNAGLVAVNRATGDVEWRTTAVAVDSPPTVTDDGVYATGDRTVVALDHGGTERWRHTIDARTGRFRLVVVGDDTVFAPFDRRLLAYDPKSGDLRWEYEPDDGPSLASAVVANGTAVRASIGGVEAVATNGTRQWLADAPDEDLLRPAVGDGTVFTLGLFGTVTAYDLSSGDRLWQASVGDGEWTQETPPVLLDGTLVVPQSDGSEVSVHGLDPGSGERRWSVSTTAARIRGPVAASGRLVLTTGSRHPNQEGDSPVNATIRAYEL